MNSYDHVLDRGVFILLDEDDRDRDSSSLSFARVREAMYWILYHNTKENPLPELTMLVMSKGGDLALAWALSEVMASSVIPVKTVGIGEVASAGLLIFMAGAKGRRFLTPRTSILSHLASWSPEMGSPRSARELATEQERCEEAMIAHYHKHTGLPVSTIKKNLLTGDDIYITPEQAVKFGIADGIDRNHKWSGIFRK